MGRPKTDVDDEEDIGQLNTSWIDPAGKMER
jgi:hypothetical protein